MLRLAVISLLALSACAKAPAGADGYAGAPIRTLSLDNGIEIEVIVEGEGPAAVLADRVEIHYILELDDGTRVDSSHDGKPMSLLILEDDGVIEGLQHGVLGMRAGERRRILVPAKLGYGDRRVGRIPAKARLHFDVELMALHPNPY